MDQYFTKSPKTASNPKSWPCTILGRAFRFTTDNGVFSKNEIDLGSRILIEVFQEPDIPGAFLDLGCGYGPISVVLAANFPSRQVIGVDINERAIALAKHNQQQNKMMNITFKESDKLSAVREEQFAAVLTNPPIRAGKQVVHEMFEEAKKVLISKGELWVVIRKKQGAPSAKKKLEELFNQVDVVHKEKGYYIIRAKTV